MPHTAVTIGRTTLKNPIIAGAGEHLIEADGVRRALRAGVGAVVVKSTNEMERGKDQLQRAEYMLLDEKWREIPWTKNAPDTAFFATRSGLSPLSFEAWLEQAVTLDREAKVFDAYAIASLIVADLDKAVGMAQQIEQAGIRMLELNIGTPYASQAKGVVATEFDPARVTTIVSAIRKAISIPLWIKITGQSERVPDLAAAAYEAGGEAVVMAGRLLGFVPDVETMEPFLSTTLGVGGYWNLPLTCHWLSVSRQQLGPGRALVGTNGARSGLDVARMMLSGASAVEMTSEVILRGTSVLEQSVKEFASYLQRKNLNAADIIGMAADRRKTFADMPLRTNNWRKYVADLEK